MKELVEIIARSLVDNPDMVNVNEIDGEQSIILELKVAPEDMGKVIGKQGRIAKAIRTVVKAAAIKDNKRVDVVLLGILHEEWIEKRPFLEKIINRIEA